MKQSPFGGRWLILVGMVTFAGAFAASAAGIVPIPRIELRLRARIHGTYQPSYQRVAGPQLIMVYMGKANCAWSNQPWLSDSVDRVKLELAHRARSAGSSFKAVGVALDWSVQEGLGHLDKFGQFDEVAAGYNWGGDAALRYIWEDIAGPPATPQLLIFERVYQVPDTAIKFSGYQERDVRVLQRLVGTDEITRWMTNGMPLPASYKLHRRSGQHSERSRLGS